MIINKGDIIKLKPVWMDEGDENYTFIATENYDSGKYDEPMDRIHISALEHKDMPIVPTLPINIYMIESIN